MKKLLLLMLLIPSALFAKGYQDGNTLFIMQEKSVKVIFERGGNVPSGTFINAIEIPDTIELPMGADRTGKMRFRLQEIADPLPSPTPWTDWEPFNWTTTASLSPMVEGKEYKLQVIFCDVLGNCNTDDQLIESTKLLQWVEKVNLDIKITIQADVVLRLGN